jgi:hypothetical protein
MRIKRLGALVSLTVLPLAATGGFPSGYDETSFDEALRKASENGKPIVLYLERPTQ